jgi:sarcosine oxidase, subunit delta
VFNRAGEPGIKKEWWYHISSGTWFIAERDTLSDEIIRTYLYSEIKNSD